MASLGQTEYAESRFAPERHLGFQGSAKIDLSSLDTGPEWQLDQRRLDELIHVFENGIDPLRLENHVDVIVSREKLHQALNEIGLSVAEFRARGPDNYPALRFPRRSLRCLHGKHRVQAGRVALPPRRRWWIVDLYVDDTSNELQSYLAEAYSHETRHSTGELYVKMRQAQLGNDELSEKRWRARLTACELSRLQMLQKNPDLYSAFDAFMDMPGILESGAILTVWNKFISLRCNDELVYYLKQTIYKFWASLMENDPTKMSKIDSRTVGKLEGFAPGVSEVDKIYVSGLVLGGDVFRYFNLEERQAINEKLQRHTGRIPSLRLFFEDTNFLTIAAHRVKWLIDPSDWASDQARLHGRHIHRRKQSIRDKMEFIFHGTEDGDTVIQTSEDGSRSIRSDNRAFDTAYRQVWLCALRVSSGSPGNSKRPAVLRSWAPPHAQYRLSQLAHQVGFRSDRIALSIGSDTQPESPPWDAFEVKKEPSLKRSGIPYVVTFKTDRDVLFLDRVGADPGECRELPSSFILRDIYNSFFGPWQDTQADEQQESSPNAATGDSSGEPAQNHHVPASAEPSNPSHDVPAADTEPPCESRPTSPDAHRNSSTTASATHAAATEAPAPVPASTSGGNPSATSVSHDEPATSVPNPEPTVNQSDQDHTTARSKELKKTFEAFQVLHDGLQSDLQSLNEASTSLDEILAACEDFVWPDASDVTQMAQDLIDEIEKIRKSSVDFQSKIDQTKNERNDLTSHVINTDKKVQEQMNRMRLWEQESAEPENTLNILQEANKVYSEACDERLTGLRNWTRLEQGLIKSWCELGNLQVRLYLMCIGNLINASESYSTGAAQFWKWEEFFYIEFRDSDEEEHRARLSALDQASSCLAGLLESLQQRLNEVRDLRTQVTSRTMARDQVRDRIKGLKGFCHESQKTFIGWKNTINNAYCSIMGKYGPVALSHGRKLEGDTESATRSCKDIASTLDNVQKLHTSMLDLLDSEPSLSSLLDHSTTEKVSRIPEMIGTWESADNWVLQKQAACIDNEGKVKTLLSQLESPADFPALKAACEQGVKLDGLVKECSGELQQFNKGLRDYCCGLEDGLLMLAKHLTLKAQASVQLVNGAQRNNIKDLQEAIKVAKSAEADLEGYGNFAESVKTVAQNGNISNDACRSIEAQVREVGEARINIGLQASEIQTMLCQNLIKSVEPFLEKIEQKSKKLNNVKDIVGNLPVKGRAKIATECFTRITDITKSIYENADEFAMCIPNPDLFVPDEFLEKVRATQKDVSQSSNIAFELHASIASTLEKVIQDRVTTIQEQQRVAQGFDHGQRQKLSSINKKAELAMKTIVDNFSSLEGSLQSAIEQQSMVETCKLKGWATDQGQIPSEIRNLITSAAARKDEAETVVNNISRLMETFSEKTAEAVSPLGHGVRAETSLPNPTNLSSGGVQHVPMQIDESRCQELLNKAKSLEAGIKDEQKRYVDAGSVSVLHAVDGTISAIKNRANEADGTGQALHALLLPRDDIQLMQAIEACLQVMIASIGLLGQIVKDVKENSKTTRDSLVTERDTAKNAARAEDKEKHQTCVKNCHQLTEAIDRTGNIAEVARLAAEEISRLGHTTWRPELPQHTINIIQEMNHDMQVTHGNIVNANETSKEAKIAWSMETASRNQRKAEEEWEVADRKFKLTNQDPLLNEWNLGQVAHNLASEAYEQAKSHLSTCEETESDFEARAKLFQIAYVRAQAASKAADKVMTIQAKGRYQKRKTQNVKVSEERDVVRRGSTMHPRARTKHIFVFKIQQEGEWESEHHTVKPGKTFQTGQELAQRGVLYCLTPEGTKLGTITADTFETLAIKGETIFFLQEGVSSEIGSRATPVELKDRAVAYRKTALEASRE